MTHKKLFKGNFCLVLVYSEVCRIEISIHIHVSLTADVMLYSSDYSRSLWTEEYFPLQMDYRSLVHEKDEAVYSEIRVIVLDLRGFYVSNSLSFVKQKKNILQMSELCFILLKWFS